MAFETFTRKTMPTKGTRSAVSLTQAGRISFNSVAIHKILEQKITSVLLSYDPDTLTIAIQPIDDDDPRAFVLRFAGADDRHMVAVGFHATIFFKHIDYDFKSRGTTAYPAVWDEKERQWTVQIND